MIFGADEIDCHRLFPASVPAANALYWFISRAIQSLTPTYLVFFLFKKRSLTSKRKSVKHINVAQVDDMVAGNEEKLLMEFDGRA